MPVLVQHGILHDCFVFVGTENNPDIEILIPPVDLQTRFAEFVRAADKSKLRLHNALGRL